MKQVFVAQHPAEAYLVRGVLEAEGIPAEVHGETLYVQPQFTECWHCGASRPGN